MKQALAMALGALLTVGSAAPAAAASQIDFTGYYDVYFMNDVNLGKRAGEAAFTDSFIGHRLNLELVFQATDEISVHWRLRAPDFKRFGESGNTDMFTHYIYGQIEQSWGTLLIGRISDDYDTYGLGSLGYSPATDPAWTNRSPFDPGGRIDGIRYNRAWDNGFGLTAQYQKVLSGDTTSLSSDQDIDRVIIEPSYEWDGGGAALGFRFDRDANTNDGPVDWSATTAWYINPAVMHSWGDFSVHFEGMYGRSTTDTPGDVDEDRDGYGFYLDADYNYGPGNITLAAWWVSGTSAYDDNNGETISGLISIDDGNFYPLLVAYNGNASGWGRESDSAVSMANAAYANFINDGFPIGGAFLNDATGVFRTEYDDFFYGLSGFHKTDENADSANHWALALSGNHAFTDDISVHYALAYLALNEPNYIVATAAHLTGGLLDPGSVRYSEQEKDLGVEADLSFSFQLLDNLQFVTSFGYMFNGDAFKTLRGYNYNDTTGDVTVVWDDPKDSYVWYNTLSFSF